MQCHGVFKSKQCSIFLGPDHNRSISKREFQLERRRIAICNSDFIVEENRPFSRDNQTVDIWPRRLHLHRKLAIRISYREGQCIHITIDIFSDGDLKPAKISARIHGSIKGDESFKCTGDIGLTLPGTRIISTRHTTQGQAEKH